MLLGEDNSYANQGVDLCNKDYQDEKRQLFVQGEGAPLMPLQAGTNPVRNNDGPIDKFFTLTPTQYFLLKQWADGKFKASEATEKAVLQPRDSESVGNCVGWPMSPGIEVTWSMFNPNLYVQPYHIKHRLQNGQKHNDYKTRGLDPSRDETTIVWWFMAAVKYARYVAQEKNETQVVTMLSQALESTSVKEVQKHLAAARQKAQAEELREVIDAAASDCEHSDIDRLVQIALALATRKQQSQKTIEALSMASTSAQLDTVNTKLQEAFSEASDSEVQGTITATINLVTGAHFKELVADALLLAQSKKERADIRKALAKAYKSMAMPRIVAALKEAKQQATSDVKQKIEQALGKQQAANENLGCEPGGLTKRMAIPWQADFFQCTVQFINFTDPTINKGPTTGIPVPPTYYAHWWPPQRPQYILSGDLEKEDQLRTSTPAGFQMYYDRGVGSYVQAIMAWPYLGFVVNQNRSPEGRDYPYFVETERNQERFATASIAVRNAQSFIAGGEDGDNFLPIYYLKSDAETLLDYQLSLQAQVVGHEEALFDDGVPSPVPEPVYGTGPAAAPVTVPFQGRGLHEYHS